MRKSNLHLLWNACLCLLLCSGCGGGSDADSAAGLAGSGGAAGTAADAPATAGSVAAGNSAAAAAAAEQSSTSGLVTASIAGQAAPSGTADGATVGGTAAAGAADASEPVDEATRILREIQQMRVAAVPADLEQARQARRERNERIVELATNVLRITMNDKEKESQFHQAIGQLLEARFQMALAGTQEDVDQLYSDVQALNDRDPKSVAAAEGVYYIARFAHTKAGMLGKAQPEWLTTLSQWAREFADRFPEQQKRATALLFGAARSCELHAGSATDQELAKRMLTEARLCYTALAEGFAETSQGQEATAVLRRMALAGQPLSQFSGPTLDGGFISVEDLAGKPTLIYFWASEDKEFVEELQPVLQKVREQVPAEQLRMVGVALDEDETELESFMEAHPVPGQQIFFPNPEQRSWNSPLVRFWGISRSPSVWLVDAKGVVVSTSATTAELLPLLRKLLQ